ncbi:MAG: type VI secretion system tip protein VgrG [Burkholderiales bacterium]|nr:type VI secretion system tip protein VgrG [Burkholderiales bacterium]
MKQFAEIDSPYGADLVFSQLSATEAISQPGCYRITALSPRADLDFNKALGKHVTVRMQGTPDHLEAASSVRCFDGLVEQIALVGHQGKLFKYQIVARSWLWFLSQTHDCKVFQNQTVIEILEEVFADHPIAVVDKRTTADYTPWVYCVQYRESDLNFVSRLMEQEGIYYYFTHTPGKHALVLADGASAHDMLPRCSALPVRGADSAGRSLQECVWDVGSTRRMRPGKQVLKDYDFTRTQVNLTQARAMPGEHALGDMEVFDYPGLYDKEGDGEQFVRSQMEHLAGGAGLVYGQSDARMLACGGLMKLTHALRAADNGEYLVCASQIIVEQPDYESTGTSEQPGYSCRYQAVPSSVAYRAERATPKPFVQGPQTAVVVGPAGDEIYTDKYGRVKVQFHWDRYGKKNEKSSCWVRVSSPWAGKSFGFVQIPRIGQEVVVDFLEGDPDQPLITGRVYNAEQMPPWDLPANATQSGVLSRSSKGGAYGNANALRFEDKKGAEQLWLHAEKDQLTEVEHDEDKWVGNDRRKNIDHDETSHIKHDRTETVDNNETITIGLNRSESVGNHETIKIGVNRTESVGANESITIGANRTISVGASETASVALQRTHSVGVNETIAVGAAQEIAIGAAQMVAVGAAQTISVGLNQSTSVGANQSNDVGANQSTTVGAKQTTNVGADRSIEVGGAQSTQVGKGRSTQVGEDDALKVGKNWVVDAGDSVTIKTGSASITMKKDGTITIKGKDITVDGSGKINIKASSDVVIKGSKIGAN